METFLNWYGNRIDAAFHGSPLDTAAVLIFGLPALVCLGLYVVSEIARGMNH